MRVLLQFALLTNLGHSQWGICDLRIDLEAVLLCVPWQRLLATLVLVWLLGMTYLALLLILDSLAANL